MNARTRWQPRPSASLADVVRLICPHDRAHCGACTLRAVTLFPRLRRRVLILAERQRMLAAFALRLAA